MDGIFQDNASDVFLCPCGSGLSVAECACPDFIETGGMPIEDDISDTVEE